MIWITPLGSGSVNHCPREWWKAFQTAIFRFSRPVSMLIPYLLHNKLSSSFATKVNKSCAGESWTNISLCRKFIRFRSRANANGKYPKCHWHSAIIVLSNVLNILQSTAFDTKHKLDNISFEREIASRLYCKIGLHFVIISDKTSLALLLIPIFPNTLFTAPKNFAFLAWKSYFNCFPAKRTKPRYWSSCDQGMGIWFIRISAGLILALFPTLKHADYLHLVSCQFLLVLRSRYWPSIAGLLSLKIK